MSSFDPWSYRSGSVPSYDADSYQDPGYRDRVAEYYARVRTTHNS